MSQPLKKIFCLLLALTFWVCALSGCKKVSDPMAKSGVGSLTLDSKNRVNAVVSLDIRTVQAHTGEKAYIYELLPGEDTAALASRQPLDEAKVSSTLEFRFPLNNGSDDTRLYSSFVVGFEDGTFLSSDGYWIENPQRLAKDTRDFPWASSPKGLLAENADDAFALGAMHVMYELRLSELFNGTDMLSFGGDTYAVSAEKLAALDGQIIPACNAGMQVSLTVIADTFPSYKAFAAAVDHLAARYTDTEGTSLSAIFIKGAESIHTALLCRLADQALRSHVANGRVYVTSTSADLTEVKTFFSNLQLQLSAGGAISWGVAVVPQISEQAPWEETFAGGVLSIATLPELSSFLFTAAGDRPSYFAVCDLVYSADDEDKQAVSYAYAYRAAVAANAGLIFYGDHVSDTAGLRAENGDAHRIASLFRSIDAGLASEDRLLCQALAGSAWTSDSTDLTSRLTVSGVGNAGTGGLQEKSIFDFTDGGTLGFVGVGSLSAPESHNSAAWDAPVLYTWINPVYENRGGVRKVLSDASLLKDTSSISIQLLTQLADAETCTAYLSLEGESENGTRVTYETRVQIKNGSWQTVTCQIGNFIAEADLSRPCVLSVTTEPDTETDEDYVLWVKGLNVRRPSNGSGKLLPVVLIAASVAVGFLAVFLIYRKTADRRSRRR